VRTAHRHRQALQRPGDHASLQRGRHRPPAAVHRTRPQKPHRRRHPCLRQDHGPGPSRPAPFRGCNHRPRRSRTTPGSHPRRSRRTSPSPEGLRQQRRPGPHLRPSPAGAPRGGPAHTRTKNYGVPPHTRPTRAFLRCGATESQRRIPRRAARLPAGRPSPRSPAGRGVSPGGGRSRSRWGRHR
jgi:hypothetical protein